ALAAQAIRAGEGDVYIAGGIENMSRAPYLMDRPEMAYSPALPKFRKSQLAPERIGNPPMGITAENLAEKYDISRQEQDEYAFRSQQRMAEAVEKGKYNDQIIPISVPRRKQDPLVYDQDEHPRPNSTLEGMGKLRPAFKQNGSVTAGNSSGLNDAVSALVVMSREEAKKLGITPLATVHQTAVAGVDPNIMGIGPVPAIKKVLEKSKLSLNDMDLIELNEAFASQVLACDRELAFDLDKVNINGGAIAHGHPLGATGAILATKAVYELQQTNRIRALF